MMKSLSRLFGGGKSGNKPAEQPSGKSTQTESPRHEVPKPKRPVEVLVADQEREAAAEAGGAMFDTEAPLSVEPVRHEPGAAPEPTDPSPTTDDVSIELDEESETVTMTPAHDEELVAGSAVDVHRVEDDDDLADDDVSDALPALNTRKGKAEMLNQLRKNYDEVLGIVRKVDQHLDDQARRSERMLEIAERTATHLEKLEHLGPMSERTAQMADAMTELVKVTQNGNDQAASTGADLMKAASEQLEAQRAQTSTLREVKDSVDRVGEADRDMADSIKGFTDTIGGVKTATNELGVAITSMRENDAERERELAQIVAKSQRWLIVTVVVVGVVAVGALAAVLMSAF